MSGEGAEFGGTEEPEQQQGRDKFDNLKTSVCVCEREKRGVPLFPPPPLLFF